MPAPPRPSARGCGRSGPRRREPRRLDRASNRAPLPQRQRGKAPVAERNREVAAVRLFEVHPGQIARIETDYPQAAGIDLGRQGRMGVLEAGELDPFAADDAPGRR